jgi:hypothetical protein
MSSSYIGSSSGSVSGASSSGVHGGSSALTMSILRSVSTVGEDIALNSSAPSIVARPSVTPPSSPTILPAQSGLSTWIVIFIVAIIGFFAWREL